MRVGAVVLSLTFAMVFIGCDSANDVQITNTHHEMVEVCIQFVLQGRLSELECRGHVAPGESRKIYPAGPMLLEEEHDDIHIIIAKDSVGETVWEARKTWDELKLMEFKLVILP